MDTGSLFFFCHSRDTSTSWRHGSSCRRVFGQVISRVFIPHPLAGPDASGAEWMEHGEP